MVEKMQFPWKCGHTFHPYSTDVMNMKLLSVITTPSIYHGCSTRKTFWEEKFTSVKIKIVVVIMLGNTGRSRTVSSTSPWTSLCSLIIWTRWKSHLQNQKIIWEDQESGWLPRWVSSSLWGQRKLKRQGLKLMKSVLRRFF